jgi:acetylornithine deacetylase/succinyl-diaminopimelate desuccinylase-like protein
MKGGNVAMAEALKVIKEAGIPLQGSILLTAHGGEEAPVGHSDELKDLLDKGVHGDVCIIAEPVHDYIPVTGKGMCQFNISIDREGESIHEIQGTEATPNPLLTANDLIQVMRERADAISNVRHEYLGTGSYFFGVLKGGDFFNRIPNHVEIAGTRRYLPGQSFSEIVREIDDLVSKVNPPQAIKVNCDLYNPFEPFELDQDEKLITCLRDAHQDITNNVLPFGGTVMGGEGSLFINRANVPTVYYGLNGKTIHSDTEYVTVDDLLRTIKVLIKTAISYLS